MLQRRDVSLSAAFFFVTLFLFVLSYRIYFWGGQSYEFCQYAEMASNLLEGKGFVTRSFYPSDLAFLEAAGIQANPYGPALWRYSANVAWVALWMMIGGKGDFGAALANGAAHALWVVLVFWMARWLFTRRVGVVAAALWAVHPMMLAGYDLWGTPDVLFGLVFGLFNVVWWRWIVEGRAENISRVALLGVVAGLLPFVRPNFIIWVPLYLGSVLLAGRRRLVLAGGFLVPFLIASTTTIGARSSPVMLCVLAFHVLVPIAPWMEYRTYAWSDFFNGPAFAALFEKWNFAFFDTLKSFPGLWAEGCLMPFLVSCVVSREGRAPKFLTGCFLLLAWQVFIHSFLSFETLGIMDGRYYLWFAPLVVIGAVGYLEPLLASKRGRTVVIIVAVLLAHQWAMFMVRLVGRPDHESGRPIPEWPEIAYIREQTPASARVMTNIPTQVTWYAGRSTIAMPNRPEDLARMQERWPVDRVFISFHRIGELFNYPQWKRVFSGQGWGAFFHPLGFVVEKEFTTGILLRNAGSPGGR